MGLIIVTLILIITLIVIAATTYSTDLGVISVLFSILLIICLFVEIAIVINVSVNKEINFERMKQQGTVYEEMIEAYEEIKINDVTSSEIYLNLRNDIVKYNVEIMKNQKLSKSFMLKWFYNSLYDDLHIIQIK